jgi:hypothetical protein
MFLGLDFSEFDRLIIEHQAHDPVSNDSIQEDAA